MSLLKIRFPKLDNENTFITLDVAKAVTAIPVKNSQGLVADDYLVVGELNVEDSEIRKIASVTDADDIVTDAMVHAHPSGTKLYKLKFNQVEISRAATATGTYSVLDTIDLEVDSPNGTIFDDTSGTASSWYKIRFKNETTSAFSGYSQPYPAAGLSLLALGSLIYDVSITIGDPDFQYISREAIAFKLRKQYLAWWLSPYTKRELKDTLPLVTVASQEYVTIPDTFDRFVDQFSVWYRYNPSAAQDQWGNLRILTKAQFRERFSNNLAVDNDYLKACYLDETVSPRRLYLGPTPVSADKVLEIDAWAKPGDLTADTDIAVCPLPQFLTIPVAMEILIGKDETTKVSELKEQLNDLKAGSIEHNRVLGGSTQMIFRRDHGSRRFF